MRRLFDRRYRGFRVVNFAAAGVLLALALGVYLAKTEAGREATAIAKVERQIALEKKQIRMLQAEVAALNGEPLEAEGDAGDRAEAGEPRQEDRRDAGQRRIHVGGVHERRRSGRSRQEHRGAKRQRQ